MSFFTGLRPRGSFVVTPRGHTAFELRDLRHTDWQAVDRRFRPQVTTATKPAELFQILQQMIEPLRDAHTSLYGRHIKTSTGCALTQTIGRLMNG